MGNTSKESAIEKMFVRAWELEGEGKLKQAQKIYQAIRTVNPLYVGALNNLGCIFFYVDNDLAQAEEYFKRVTEIDARHVIAHYNRASLYDDMGRYGLAVDFFSLTLEFDPLYARAHYNLGLLYAKIGRMDNMQKHLELYLELEEDDVWNKVALRILRGEPNSLYIKKRYASILPYGCTPYLSANGNRVVL